MNYRFKESEIMAKQQLPVWNSEGVEPPASLKNEGWEPGVKPPAQYFDWLFNRTYKCLEELQAIAEELKTNKANGADLTAVSDMLTTYLDEFNQHLQKTASLIDIGHTQLSNAIDSTLDTLAATPSAVKQAYDRGSEAFNDTSELYAEFLAFKTALTEGFTANQFSDGLTTLTSFNVTAGYYNQSQTRLEV